MKNFRLTACCLLVLIGVAGAELSAATKMPSRSSSLPGEVLANSQGFDIPLENGRSLRWSLMDEIDVVDAAGKTQLSVSLKSAAVKESSAAAMGQSVEETDLGGSMSSKSYLSGKKKPVGRAFDSSSLSDQPTAGQANKEQKSTVDGIAITTVEYPNGASLLRFAWPDATEEVYFDRKKTLVHRATRRQAAGFTVDFKQWAEGSFARRYFRGDAGVAVTYDDNDGSTLFEFFNAKGESIAQLNCRDECTPVP